MFNIFFILLANVEISASKLVIPPRFCEASSKLLTIPKIVLIQEHLPLMSVILLCSQIDLEEKWDNNSFRVLVAEMEPYVKHSNSSSTALTGYVGDIWTTLSEILYIKYEVSSVHYSQGIHRMNAGKAEIFLGSAVAGRRGIEKVLISQPYLINWYNLYMKTPEQEVNSSYYLKTFSTKLWVLTIISFTVLTITTWITGRIVKRVNPLEPTVSIPSCFLGVISGIINQGFDLKFRSYSARTLIYSALILGLLLYSATSALLYSRMTIFDVPFPFQSLNDIASKRWLSLCLRNDSFIYEYFVDENMEVLPEWQNIVNDKHCLNIIEQENIKKIICKDNVILLENRIVMSAFLKRTLKLPCDVVHLKSKYFTMGNVFLFGKHLEQWKQYHDIKKLLIRLKSSGILSYLQDKYIRQYIVHSDYSQKWYQVTMDHIRGVIYFYILMIALSFFILIFEICHEKYLALALPASLLIE